MWAKKREKNLVSKWNMGSFCLDGITKIMAFVWGGMLAVGVIGLWHVGDLFEQHLYFYDNQFLIHSTGVHQM